MFLKCSTNGEITTLIGSINRFGFFFSFVLFSCMEATNCQAHSWKKNHFLKVHECLTKQLKLIQNLMFGLLWWTMLFHKNAIKRTLFYHSAPCKLEFYIIFLNILIQPYYYQFVHTQIFSDTTFFPVYNGFLKLKVHGTNGNLNLKIKNKKIWKKWEWRCLIKDDTSGNTSHGGHLSWWLCRMSRGFSPVSFHRESWQKKEGKKRKKQKNKKKETKTGKV